MLNIAFFHTMLSATDAFLLQIRRLIIGEAKTFYLELGVDEEVPNCIYIQHALQQPNPTPQIEALHIEDCRSSTLLLQV